MNKALAIFALLFLMASIGLGIVALATSNWMEKDDNSMGFFQSCEKENDPIRDKNIIKCTNNLDDDHVKEYEDDGKCRLCIHPAWLNIISVRIRSRFSSPWE